MGSQLSTRRGINPTKERKTSKVFGFGFLSDDKEKRMRRHYGRSPARGSARTLPNAYTSTHYRDQEHLSKPIYQYHSDRSDRHNGRYGTARRSSSTSPPVVPVSNTHQFGSQRGLQNHPSEVGPPTVYPQSQAVIPSRANRRAHATDYGPPVYPQAVMIPPSSKSAHSRHESDSRNGTQLAIPINSSTAAGSLVQPSQSDRYPSYKRHHYRESTQQSSNFYNDSPAYRSLTTYNYVVPEENRPGVMTISNHTEYRIQPGQRPIQPAPPVPQTQPSPPTHSRHAKLIPQTWETWKPPVLQQFEHTKPVTYRSHRSEERASRRPSASNQSLPVMSSQDRHRVGGESRPGGRSSKSHRPNTSHEESSDDRGRRYDRSLGERAAERRAPKSSKRSSVSTEAPVSTTATPMKFYRPGDPRHPSFKPISPEFKRRHART